MRFVHRKKWAQQFPAALPARWPKFAPFRCSELGHARGRPTGVGNWRSFGLKLPQSTKPRTGVHLGVPTSSSKNSLEKPCPQQAKERIFGKVFEYYTSSKKLSTKKVWKLKCSKLLVWFVSGPDRLDGSETVFCCKADVDGGQTHQWHAFETLVIFFHALGPCARSRFTCKGGSASGLDAASCRFRRCNSLSLRLSMKLSCLVVVPVWLCASTLSQLFEDVFLGKLR